jgi:hypothetical protein
MVDGDVSVVRSGMKEVSWRDIIVFQRGTIRLFMVAGSSPIAAVY